MQSKIEQQVMASVATVYTVRSLVSATAVKVYALAASLWALGALVWVARVEENFAQVMHGGVSAMGTFAIYALSHTSIAVQAVLVVAILALASLARDAARTLSSRQIAF